MELRERLLNWPLDGENRNREAVARELERLKLPLPQHQALWAIFELTWPTEHRPDWRPGTDGMELSLADIADKMRCHANTARTQLVALEARGWIIITSARAGRKRCIAFAWDKLFETPTTPTRTYTVPLQQPTHPYNETPTNLEGLEGFEVPEIVGVHSKTVPLQRPIVGVHQVDSDQTERLIEALNRHSKALEAYVNAIQNPEQKQERPTDPYNETPTNLEGLYPHNPSNRDPYIDISISKIVNKYGNLDGAEEDKTPHIGGERVWERSIYPFTRDQLRDNTFVDRLFEQASTQGKWPTGDEGRTQFFTLVCYALAKDSTREGPCRIVTSAVQRQAYGDKLWQEKDSRSRALERIKPLCRGSLDPPTAKSIRPADEIRELDARIAELTDDQACELLPPEWQARYRQAVTRGGNPRTSLVMDLLRKSVSNRQEAVTCQ